MNPSACAQMLFGICLVIIQFELRIVLVSVPGSLGSILFFRYFLGHNHLNVFLALLCNRTFFY